MQGAAVGMWFGGFVPATTSMANVGVVRWQSLHSPVVGCIASSAAEGLESPAVAAVLGTIPRYGAVAWQVLQGPTPAIVRCPVVLSVGALMFAAPMLNPPAFTLALVWQPAPLQSTAPMGM